MKSKILILLLGGLGLLNHAKAQRALNATGNTLSGGNVTYTYSLGELGGFTLSNTCKYTQGVVQPRCNCKVVSTIEAFDEKYQAHFYPNPANDQITVETDFADFAQYRITTADGQQVETAAFNYSPICLGQLQAGAYYLRLLSADSKTIKTVKIIKQ